MGKEIVLLWRKVGGENIPRLTGRTGCSNRNSTEEPVPEAGSRYRRGFSFVERLPRNRPGTGQHPRGSLLPHALHQRIGTGAFVPLTGSMDRKAPLYTGNFTDGFCPYPGPCPPGHFRRERGSTARFTAGLLPHIPAFVRRDILTGRGAFPLSPAPGFCPYPGTRPPGYFHRERASPARLSCR